MNVNIENRERLLTAMREELTGPSPVGDEIDCTGELKFPTFREAYQPRRQQRSGEEILFNSSPLQRYGVGVLYPAKQPFVESSAELNTNEVETDHLPDEEETLPDPEALGQFPDLSGGGQEVEMDDFDLSMANSYQPSTLGLSFLVDMPPDSVLQVEVPSQHPARSYPVNGRYEKKQVWIDEAKNKQARRWWLRVPISLEAQFSAADICKEGVTRLQAKELEVNNAGPLNLSVELVSRPHGDNSRQRLVTACLINRTDESFPLDANALFQTYMRVHVKRSDGKSGILPYPGPPLKALDDEEKSLALLYHEVRSYATGHGCAADWDKPDNDGVSWVSAECLPQVEVPAMTPDIVDKDNTPITVSMKAMGQLSPGNTGFADLQNVVAAYEDWIQKEKTRISALDLALQETARRHLDECQRCADRMRRGINYLLEDEVARFAFQLANQAILLQQKCGDLQLRRPEFDKGARRLNFIPAYQSPVDEPLKSGRGTWRAFQIAFLLMSIESTGEPEIEERNEVELIWFPTGGGKTEAYLGLAAFALFLRRLKNKEDAGVHVLMRYTLRLLTAQQFQRASGLIVSMDYLRQQHRNNLGDIPFSIGIWLGSSTTPNNRNDAKKSLQELERGDRYARNRFLLTRCPWCGAHMGPLKEGRISERTSLRKNFGIPGYERRGNTVVLLCPDSECPFDSELPVYVIDEDIYDKRPDLVIGTADKFARLTWRDDTRSLFGIDSSGERFASPPGLIIQDELHLIAGPLGSMIGLYEVVIEDLCTDYRNAPPIPPKIVCSTATIRRYEEQILALYGREKVTLFPPPGLGAGDSFFSRYATFRDGRLRPGKIYAGIHAPGLGSLQTAQVRTFSALLQAPVPLREEERDPWWTLLIFFNSLRELGGALSLFQSDILDYLNTLRKRQELESSNVRRIYSDRVLELTSRLESEEVPAALEQLGISTTDKRPVDVCLASNIIEVGIDVSRLSLMAIVGQPKSTAQYIQVSGRVGRNSETPGLVVTLYSASKPRDRSHFEKFRSYHEQLYAQVEPTSVTPFSPPALDRALHAVMAAYVRQRGAEAEIKTPDPVPEAILSRVKQLLIARIALIDSEEQANFDKVFERRLHQWRQGERDRWSSGRSDEDPPLLHRAGEYMPEDWRQVAWPTPDSMRTVDSECRLKISLPRTEES